MIGNKSGEGGIRSAHCPQVPVSSPFTPKSIQGNLLGESGRSDHSWLIPVVKVFIRDKFWTNQLLARGKRRVPADRFVQGRQRMKEPTLETTLLGRVKLPCRRFASADSWDVDLMLGRTTSTSLKIAMAPLPHLLPRHLLNASLGARGHKGTPAGTTLPCQSTPLS
jgi:hypothetical protein